MSPGAQASFPSQPSMGTSSASHCSWQYSFEDGAQHRLATIANGVFPTGVLALALTHQLADELGQTHPVPPQMLQAVP